MNEKNSNLTYHAVFIYLAFSVAGAS